MKDMLSNWKLLRIKASIHVVAKAVARGWALREFFITDYFVNYYNEPYDYYKHD